MKNLYKIALKAAVVIVLLAGGVVALSVSGIKTVSESKAAPDVTTVTGYLTSNSYYVISLYQGSVSSSGSCRWTAYTIKNGINYRTTVYASGTVILGHTDVQL